MADDPIARWKVQVAAGLDRGQLVSTLRSVASDVRRYLAPARNLRDEWEPVGVEVERWDLHAAGGHIDLDGRPRIFVTSGDNRNRQRQRFTVAHELCHVLIGDNDRRCERALSPDRRPKNVEELCDQFANWVLIDRRQLRRALRARPEISTPYELFDLAREFDVSPASLSTVLREVAQPRDHVLIISSERPHHKRGGVPEQRVDGSWCPGGIYVPPDTRLTTLGMAGLATFATGPEHRDGSGTDRAVLEARRPTRPATGKAHGIVEWVSSYTGDPLRRAVTVVDVRSMARCFPPRHSTGAPKE